MIQDRLWRLGNLFMIRPEEGGAADVMRLRPEQREFAEGAHGRDIIIKTRKLGFSTSISLGFLDDCLTMPGMHSAVIDRTEADAQKKLAIAKLAWDNGPNHPVEAIRAIWLGIRERVKLTAANQSELVFSNGSRMEAGVSFRGGTPQRLHISEFGPVACEDPRRAQEIVSGAMAAVPPSGRIAIETTYKGGRFGHCYRIAKQAMDNVGLDLSPLDWKFWGFWWWQHPSYQLPGRRPSNAETFAYFADLERDHGIFVDDGRKAWWEATRALQQEAIFQEYPSNAQEVFTARLEGLIYPQMAKLRAQGRLSKALAAEVGPPLLCAWDLGISDFMAGWLVQPAGRDLLWLRWCQFEGQGAERMADQIRQWEAEFGRPIAQVLLPHDGNKRDIGSGKTFAKQLQEAGIASTRITVVPRSPDVWDGIRSVRAILPKSWFDVSCDRSVKLADGTELPSGVGCLEAYRRQPPTGTGVVREMPLHDLASHTADAARTFGEGFARGLVGAAAVESAARPTVNLGDPWGNQAAPSRSSLWDDLESRIEVKL